MMNLTTACWVIKMVNARNIGVSNHQVSAYAALPEDTYSGFQTILSRRCTQSLAWIDLLAYIPYPHENGSIR
jgi:hypothetical protein